MTSAPRQCESEPRTRELFAEALERPEPERAGFVAAVCQGDDALRREVEELLRWHARSQLGFSEDEQVLGERPGDRIGRYKLLEIIGEGGFGTVWMADQEAPVRRRVALKVLKPGLDTQQIVRRFEAERQALALMEHSNIARVFDGGATDAGRPYFAMELVRGVPITQYCDEAQLPPAARLELFVPVCQAVQHAHHKGVIHRDLKPSNVLVTLHDGKPIPKVIDFGIAKAAHGQLTDKTVFTSFRQTMGTPEYMAPEQAEMSGLDIDTRADVYSLGVLLYELLTGTKPFDMKEALDAGFQEFLRRVKEVEPEKPSTRVSTVGKRATDIAIRRGLQPQALSGVIRGDLDWIILKALEKERARRYETAHALAQDIERHLKDEPVLAGPPSRAYRLRKYVRRHRVAVAASAAILLALAGGLVAALIGYAEAKEQTKRARDSESKAVEARAAADSFQAEERRQKEAALREKDRADAALRDFDQLKGVALYQQAIDAQGKYYPEWPQHIDAMEHWLDDVRALLATRPDVQRTVDGLRAVALPRTPEEVEADRRAHPRYAELQALELRTAGMRHAHSVRSGAQALVVPELTAEQRALDAATLNDLAWERVAPTCNERGVNGGDASLREVYGEEAQGLAFARGAVAMSAGSAGRASMLDTLAWALLANGQDAEARAASDEALASVSPDDDRYFLELQKRCIESAIEEASERLTSVEKSLMELAEQVNTRKTFIFDAKSQQFLHDTLADLLVKLTSLEAKQKVDIERRLRWAKEVQALTLGHPRARHTWAEARAAIARADDVVASRLYAGRRIELRDEEVVGLVPIGMNPVTKLWEFYDLRSAWDGSSDPRELAIPRHQSDGSIEVTERMRVSPESLGSPTHRVTEATADTGIVFVLLPGGTVTIGSQQDDPSAPYYDSELAGNHAGLRVVQLSPFFLARHELTQGQWRRLCTWGGKTEPSFYSPRFRIDGVDPYTWADPVEQVDWEMCNTLLTRHGLVLPTEAQWEYGCRGGTTTPWNASEEELALREWLGDPALPSRHIAVGLRQANALGLFDMHGNVSEWCRDYWDTPGRERDGDGLSPGDVYPRRYVYRGGSCLTGPEGARSAARYAVARMTQRMDLGVRAARLLTSESH